jgi:hypothetical protein
MVVSWSWVGDKAASDVRLMERAALPSAGPLTRNKERFPHQRITRVGSYFGGVMAANTFKLPLFGQGPELSFATPNPVFGPVTLVPPCDWGLFFAQ